MLLQQNRPLNAQMVSDALQKHGIKKQAVQKVMDTLAANGKISFKDYGKQRVCLASQAQFEIPDMDELEAMKKHNEQLQVDVASIRSHVGELEAGMDKPSDFCNSFRHPFSVLILELVFAWFT